MPRRRNDPTSRDAILRASAAAERLMGRELARGLAHAAAAIRDAARRPDIATSAKARADAYREILVALAEAGGKMTPELERAIDKRCREVADGTAKALPDNSPHRYELTKEQRIDAVNGKTARQLVATQTQSMAEHAVRELRTAFVEAMRRGQVEGWTAIELQKRIQEAWDEKAGDENAFRFVDRGGRAWSNATYLQMAVRTTMQKITRNQMCATLAGNGYDVARISDDGGGGDDCDACSRWEGRLVSITGATKGLPTLADAEADGLFHPNCVHRIEYVDDDELPKQYGGNAEDDGDGDEHPQWSPTTQVERETDARMQSIGVTHTDEDLPLSGVNPHFSDHRRYRVNCQRCVVASELRRRGYDVEANPARLRGGDDVANHWREMFDGQTWSRNLQDKGAVDAEIGSMPQGARAVVRVFWNNRDNHVFNAENTGSGVRYTDGQNNSVDASDYFQRGVQGRFEVSRIDNLPPSDWGAKAVSPTT